MVKMTTSTKESYMEYLLSIQDKIKKGNELSPMEDWDINNPTEEYLEDDSDHF